MALIFSVKLMSGYTQITFEQINFSCETKACLVSHIKTTIGYQIRVTAMYLKVKSESDQRYLENGELLNRKVN